jgi:hypothetical protein
MPLIFNPMSGGYHDSSGVFFFNAGDDHLGAYS